MIPTWLQAIVLGLVQGITEFVPISSSGHLVFVPYLLGWQRPGLPFDAALHAGTALAVIVYFRTELVGIVLAVLRGGRGPTTRFYRRLLGLLALASLPVAVVGLTLRKVFEALFETPPVAAAFMLVTAVVILAGERLRQRRLSATRQTASKRSASSAGEATDTNPPGSDLTPDEAADRKPQEPVRAVAEVGLDPEDPAGTTLDGMRAPLAFGVGLAQAFALFPGLSRSGMTITAGIAGGLTRVAATRFAFLLSLPALIGAFLVNVPALGESGPYSGADIAAGVLAATVASYAAIAFLIRLVARASLSIFAGYLAVAGVLGLVAYAVLGPPGTF